MKLILTYLFLIITFTSFGQVSGNITLDSISYFYTVDKDTIQGEFSFEKSGSGHITQFRKVVYKKENLIRPLPLTKETEFTYETQILPLFYGDWLDGQKTGIWTNYFDSGVGYSWEHSISPEHSIVYKTDTIVYLTFKTKIFYVNDSMYVYGSVLTRSNYIINCECKNKEDCIYWYQSKEKIIETSKYDEFELIIARFEYGEYDRKIKLTQNK
jgi:hypothetical protein